MENQNNKKIVLKIQGMMCMHCVAHVKKALEELEGVKSVEVSLEKGEAVLETGLNFETEKAVNAVIGAGYQVI